MTNIKVEIIRQFVHSDLSDIAQATEDAIREGIGFNWVVPPGREVIESYWEGVLVVPHRILLVGKLDETIVGSIQLIKPGHTKETSSFSATVEAHFVAPWARGHGIAKILLEHAEAEARKLGFSIIHLSVRETQERAIQIYEEAGYHCWGVLPYYEFVNAQMVAGRYYYKQLEPASELV